MATVPLEAWSDEAIGWRGQLYAELRDQLTGFATVYPTVPPGSMSTPCVVLDDETPVAELAAAGDTWDRTVRLRLVGDVDDNAARTSQLEGLLQAIEESTWWDQWLGATPQFMWNVADYDYPCIEVDAVIYGQHVDPWATEVSVTIGAAAALTVKSGLAGTAAVTTAATADLTVPIAFDPITDVAWANAYWAEGPEFVAQGIGDGGAVAAWPDEIDTNDFEQATGTQEPFYVAAGSINGKPCVEGDGVDDFLVRSGLDRQDHASCVIIAKLNAAEFRSNIASHSSGNYDSAIPGTLTSLWMSAANNDGGPDATCWGGASDADAHLFVIDYDSLTPRHTFTIDDDAPIVNTHAEVGNSQLGLNALMSRRTIPNQITAMQIAFVAWFYGSVSDDPGWAEFLAWVTDHYGITTA